MTFKNIIDFKNMEGNKVNLTFQIAKFEKWEEISDVT